MLTKKKGYRIERNVKIELEKNGWRVMRAGGSLGDADLIGIKKGKCMLLQIKSTSKKILYYYGYSEKELEGFPFFLVVDFGYGKIRVTEPKARVEVVDGISLKEFLSKN
jgi:Holliday junction resolvase